MLQVLQREAYEITLSSLWMFMSMTIDSIKEYHRHPGHDVDVDQLLGELDAALRAVQILTERGRL